MSSSDLSLKITFLSRWSKLLRVDSSLPIAADVTETLLTEYWAKPQCFSRPDEQKAVLACVWFHVQTHKTSTLI